VTDRDNILQDSEFWLKLEYGMSPWFRNCEDTSLRGYWCDGFIPGSMVNTKDGVDVRGTAWIADSPRSQTEWEFRASVPQTMLARRRDQFVITDVVVDRQRKYLALSVSPSLPLPNISLQADRER
jgi:hypothetical protein